MKRLAAMLAIALAAGAVLWHFAARRSPPPDQALNAQGIVRPTSAVAVRAAVAGQIKDIAADFKTPVKSGQVLARIDAASFEQRVNQARADLQASRAAKAAAALKQREKLLQQAELDLERTLIRSPVDGTVILRNADVGQKVTPDVQAPALFTIAPDLRSVAVEVALNDVQGLRPGMRASFSVDALPRRRFSGTIREIRKGRPATVIIAASNPDLSLIPGMTASVRIPLAD